MWKRRGKVGGSLSARLRRSKYFKFCIRCKHRKHCGVLSGGLVWNDTRHILERLMGLRMEIEDLFRNTCTISGSNCSDGGVKWMDLGETQAKLAFVGMGREGEGSTRRDVWVSGRRTGPVTRMADGGGGAGHFPGQRESLLSISFWTWRMWACERIQGFLNQIVGIWGLEVTDSQNCRCDFELPVVLWCVWPPRKTLG